MNARTTLASAAISALLLTTTTACGSGYGTTGTSGGSGGISGGGDVHGGADTSQPCQATFLPAGTNTDGIDTGASVKATLWVRCSIPPTEHNLTLDLQQYVTNGWQTKSERQYNKIPAAIWTPMIVSAPCVPGKWRLHWAVTGTVSGKPFAGSATGDAKDVGVHDCA